MRFNWTISAIVAGGAFVIAALSATLAAVPIGILFTRAVIGGIVFGLLSLGAQFLVQKFLPELLSNATGGSDEQNQDSGSNIDIVLDEEGDEFSPSGEEETEPASDLEPEAEELESAADELVEEVEEVGPEAEEEERPAPPADEAAERTDPRSVDELPDIGEFAESFEDSDESAGGTGSGSGSGSGGPGSGGASEGTETSGSTGGREDPQQIAKAIRTIMKRDE